MTTAAVVAAVEMAAERLGPRLLPPLPVGATEAEFKLSRLRELRRSGESPRVLIIGASPIGSCLDPAVISTRGTTGRVFNACLTGSTVPAMRRWRRSWKQEVRPEVVLVGAQPLMFIPSGRYSDAVMRDLTSLEDRYAAPPGDHPVALWRWRRGLAAALAPRNEPRPGHARAPDSRPPYAAGRHNPDGLLEAFLDVSLEAGLKAFPDDWYAYVGFDPYVAPDVAPYLGFLDELRSDGMYPIAVIPPLRLSASPSTSLPTPQDYLGGDQLLETAAEHSLDVVDLRPLATDDGDFADVFHLGRAASRRVSEACGDALVRLAPSIRR